MTETKTTPPAVEAKKQDEAAPPEAGGGGGTDGGVGAKLDKVIEMLGQMMGGMGKAAVPPAPAAEVAKAPDIPAPEKIQVAITKADIEAILDEKFKVLATGTTPRPIAKGQFEESPMAAIMKDPSRLDTMSYTELRECMGGN